MADILWRHTSGAYFMWLINGTRVIGGGLRGSVAPDWPVGGVGASVSWARSPGSVTTDWQISV